ncbi:MAG: LPS assembly protein LptD [Caulobacteraceae bacterium]
MTTPTARAYHRLRRALMAGAGLTALSFSVAFAGQAFAQDAPTATAADATPRTIVDDGLGERGFFLEADTVSQDDTAHTITATGGVEARYRGRVLRAEKVVYNAASGVVEAEGNVLIIGDDGTLQSADKVLLDKDLTAGFALGFATRLQGDVKIAAGSLIRRSPTVDELNSAIYTPCYVCADKGHPTPTWSIQADQVVRDRDRQIVYYRNAVINILGVPVLYTPIFWHADPDVQRQSGFLTPLVSGSRIRGVSYEQPYLWVINPSEDLVTRVQINQNANPFLKFDFRRRFYSGDLEARFGYTYERDLDNDGNRFGDRTSRSYVLAKGAFDISEAWRWGFTAERASEDLVFDKYNVDSVFQERGLYAVDDRRLISQIYATRQTDRSFFSVAAISVQGLRPFDDDAAFPTIAPLIEGRWEPESRIAGGRLRLRGSAVVLSRDEDPVIPANRGVDTARVTGELDWRRALTFSSGLRVEPFVLARADIYSVRDLPAPSPSSANITRGFGVAGFDISWPLVKQAGNATILLEPLAQIALGNRASLDTRIQNEDSAIFEFDSTNLFQVNKSPGFDLYEGGNRLNIGARATVTLTDGRSGSFLIGRSFRSEADPTLPTRTGLSTVNSDWIVAAEATPMPGVNFFARGRFDDSDLSVRRLEAGVDVATSRVNGFIRYLKEDVSPSGVRVEDIDIKAEVFLTANWGFTAYGVRDIDAGRWRQRDFGIVYRDDCTRVEVLYRHDETFNRALGPSESIVLRLTLATLGNSGYRR